jgi:Domain of unknown function (DUF4129)
MKSRSISNAIGNAKGFRSISYGLVFLMMVCAAMSIGILIQNALPGWHSGVIASVMLFIVIDRFYTYQQLKSLTPLSLEWVMAYVAQWIVIVLFIRFLLSYADGLAAFLTDLSLFARGYLANFFTGELVITLLLALLVWALTAQFLGLLDEIGLDQELALREDPGRIQTDVVPAHQRLVNLIFGMGIVLVILTALTRLNTRALFSRSDGIPNIEVSRFSGGEAGALLYFIFGLALLSLSRLMSLQTHWNRSRIPVSSKNLVRQWGVYSLFFLLILAVIVSLLPAGDSLGFFSVVGTLLGFLIRLLVLISQLIIALGLFLFSLPFLLFGKAPPFINRFAPPPLPTLPVQPASPITISAVWELIRSILLWGSLAVIIVYSFIRFVRQHDSVLAALRKSRITNWLILAWQWLYRNADKTRASLSHAVAEAWQSMVARLEGKQIRPRPGWMSLRSLDPRQQIYFFYLAMVRRGAEQGVTRNPSQSPSEYAVHLENALPSASEDINSITEAFVQARYSRQEVDSRKAESVKAIWGRFRNALKRKSKSEQSANK